VKEHASQFMSLPTDERMTLANRILMEVPGQQEALRRMEECLEGMRYEPPEPPCLLILGPSGAGKTTVVDLFKARYPRRDTDELTEVPVFSSSIFAPAEVGGVASKILDDLGDPDPYVGTVHGKTHRIVKLLRRCQVRMTLLDEFQHLAKQNTPKAMNKVSDWVKSILNDWKRPLVLLGLPEAESVVEANEQLRRRFLAKVVLRPYEWGKGDSIRKPFRDFLGNLDAALPVPGWSNFSDTTVAFRFHYATGGLVGYVMPIVRRAAMLAIKEGKNSVPLEVLARAYEEVISSSDREGWANPFRVGDGDLDALGSKPPPGAPPPNGEDSTDVSKVLTANRPRGRRRKTKEAA